VTAYPPGQTHLAWIVFLLPADLVSPETGLFKMSHDGPLPDDIVCLPPPPCVNFFRFKVSEDSGVGVGTLEIDFTSPPRAATVLLFLFQTSCLFVPVAMDYADLITTRSEKSAGDRCSVSASLMRQVAAV